MRRSTTALALLIPLALAGCAAEPASPGEDASAPAAVSQPIDFGGFAAREVFEPQLAIDTDGTLLMIWRQKGEEGDDLYCAHRTEGGALSAPVRINDEPGTVYAYPHDEMRPAIAVGEDGNLAVVWSDDRGQIRASFGSEHGGSWSPSVRLDQADEPAYRSFTAAGLDERGALHAIWIDARFAPQAGAEEPADLFYARTTPDAAAWGSVTEVNLTADQDSSICGCCRPDLETHPDGSIRAIFRNTTEDGFRDIFTISGNYLDGFGEPVRVGPATWRLEGCPMSGPLGLEASGLEDAVMWRDASSGDWVLKQGRPGSDAVIRVFATGGADWKMTGSPRAVVAGRGLVLVPGQPSSRLIEWRQDSWTTLRDDLPVWATSAAVVDDSLLAVGAVQGKFENQRLPGRD